MTCTDMGVLAGHNYPEKACVQVYSVCVGPKLLCSCHEVIGQLHALWRRLCQRRVLARSRSFCLPRSRTSSKGQSTDCLSAVTTGSPTRLARAGDHGGKVRPVHRAAAVALDRFLRPLVHPRPDCAKRGQGSCFVSRQSLDIPQLASLPHKDVADRCLRRTRQENLARVLLPHVPVTTLAVVWSRAGTRWQEWERQLDLPRPGGTA